MKPLFLPLLLLPLLAQANEEKIPYTCDNGSRIDISFFNPAEGRPQASLHFSDASLTLPAVPAASGAAYKQDSIALYTKEYQAYFEDGKGNVRHCVRGHQPPVSPPPPVAADSSFIDLTGNVSYLTRNALPPDAVLTLRVKDNAPAGGKARILAEQTIALDGRQVPIGFQITLDRDLIGKKSRLSIEAHIEHKGKRLFINDKNYPWIASPSAPPLSITLKPAARRK